MEELLEAGYVYVVDADLKGYFDTIPKDRLLAIVPANRSRIAAARAWPGCFLTRGLSKNCEPGLRKPGVPQGAVLSPVLANAYLNPLDHPMSENGLPKWCDTPMTSSSRVVPQADAEAALGSEVRTMGSGQRTDASLPIRRTSWTHEEKSFSFFGYSFRGKLRFPRAKSHDKFTDRIRDLTPRKSGDSLETIIQQINQTAQGWFTYFRHCHWSIFKKYDEMVRRRLRRLLLKRNRRNPKRLARHQRWPNDFFTKHGYKDLTGTHVRFVQSIGTY